MIVVTDHAIKRYRKRFGPKKASKGRVDRIIRNGLKRIQKVRQLGTGALLFETPNFEAVGVKEGKNLIIKTVRRSHAEKGLSKHDRPRAALCAVRHSAALRESGNGQMQSVCERVEVPPSQVPQTAGI